SRGAAGDRQDPDPDRPHPAARALRRAPGNGTMSHEAYAQLVPAFALGALDRDDRARFEAHLRSGCSDCERELAEDAEPLGALAAEAPPIAPSPRVRALLLERVASEHEVARPTLGARLAPLRRLAWPLAWGATVAAAAALV